jgi:hypothetical protein
MAKRSRRKLKRARRVALTRGVFSSTGQGPTKYCWDTASDLEFEHAIHAEAVMKPVPFHGRLAVRFTV